MSTIPAAGDREGVWCLAAVLGLAFGILERTDLFAG